MFKLPKAVNILITVLVAIIVLLVSFLAGAFWSSSRSQSSTTITSQVILDRITNQAILLTKTVYLDQKTQITVDQGSDWSNFWWGQTINADALIKVNVGIDLQKLSVADISVDNYNKKISIALPDAQVLDALPEGNITVTSQSGVLKYLLANDPNGDYNKALQQLELDATNVVKQKPDIITSARNDSITILQTLLKDTGYAVEIRPVN
jgi:hypothetical protein